MKFNFKNINLCKIQKITAIEVTVLALAFVAIGIYYSPNFMHKQEALMAAKIKSDNAVFTSKALEEFAQNSSVKPSDVAQKVSDELNKTSKNPYNKKEKAYTFDLSCRGCNSVEYDDNLQMIILTTYNKKGDLIARTVIKPPSFVTYTKGEDE